jgi:glycosyltransferase involved in cell wall biosynthesis
MIRVGFFLPHFRFGGIERVVLNLLRELDRERFEPVLMLGTRTGELLEEIPDDVAVHDAGGGRMLMAAPKIARMVRKSGCNVVYSGTNAANLALLAAAALVRRPPGIIVSEHTPMSLFLREAKWRRTRLFLMRVAYSRADVIAVPYSALGEELREILEAPDLPIRELHNPVMAEDAFDAEYSRPELAPNTPYLVAAGRLDPVKGFDLLLRAFALLRRRHEDISLVILGEGPERATLEALVDKLGVAESVRFPGFVEQPQAWFAHAIGLVVSSRREGTPNVIVEAMAAGAPVVATNCSYGPSWLLRHGEAGLIADPTDSNEFAEAMERLVVDRTEAARFVEAGRVQARRFSIRATTRVFEDVLEAAARPV